jgi:hypothetical protein
MGRFRNPWMPLRAQEDRGDRRRRVRFAPEALEGRLSPSSFALSGGTALVSTGVANVPEDDTPPPYFPPNSGPLPPEGPYVPA